MKASEFRSLLRWKETGLLTFLAVLLTLWVKKVSANSQPPG
jgi:hypothetical protein